ncbi:adenylate/guanylate cyclase domain-containing protein [Rhodoplanes sp. Z2-YC6860]|uniref:adenylate/guanylate cyclase domain-containing protein n=1 Tax=Rhodoplanes sp. Z2-YC6860 TaxID=674703 RepID=UPI00078DFDDE|nr:adenylate/guanylate cyclase domain-containing protein [Rhodoplanes sp. Z2-YC6860]AMN39126.1 adenylate/guanylate cyclase [Rhodoplanes sp. Z2-YC6860]
MDIGHWLKNIGFEKYETIFVENAIDHDVLLELTEADLEKLGMPLGDRKRLLRAIRAFAEPPDTGLISEGGTLRRSGPGREIAAERRHLTVMICDLVNSTALSARLDPEDMGAVMDSYHAACARIVQTYEGFLSDFRGDGIFCYFGYPRAHEDDAERTVRAALDIAAAVPRIETPAGEALAVRVGIATGLVVVGELGREGALWDNYVIGDAPNIAARLQGLAEPGGVVVASSTRRLLGGLFRLRDLGEHKVKGIDEPIAAWSVEGVSSSESRFEATHVTQMTDLIGRDKEMDFLLAARQLAWDGEGQVVLISGEPGVGKSRIAAALADRIADDQHTRLRYQCSPYDANSALRPLITQMERVAGFGSNDSLDQRLDKLEAVLAGSPDENVVPLFAKLLSVPYEHRYPSLTLSPSQQRRQTLAILLDQLESLARRQPILLLFEDMHWADATSLELLDLAIERIRNLPILALLTFRPPFEPPWGGLANVRSLVIGRLGRDDIESMIAGVVGGRALPAEVTKQIVNKTDGNPLFVEELTKTVLESGILIKEDEGYRLDGPLPPLAIPETLQDSLMARLDRMMPVKEVSQIGAAIGREFSYALVHALVGVDGTTLQHALSQLEQAELVFRHGEPPDATYTFKHALVRDAAYESMLKSRRQQLHGQIAHVLENKFGDFVERQPEIVAHHFTEGGVHDAAMDYWLKAGRQALDRSANAEAVKHLRRGIELAQLQAQSVDRARKELDFYLALGPALAATEGYATPQTLSVFSHARNLLGDGADPAEQMTILWGVYLAHLMRGENIDALDVARQCLALATAHNHPGMLALANRFMGQTLWMMGDFVGARIHLERTLDLCAANQNTITSYRRFGADDEVTALSSLSRALWILGYPDRASSAAEQSLTRARSLGLAFTTAYALDGEALLGALGADPKRATGHANEAMAHSIAHSLPDFEQRARFMQGALLTQGGDSQRGLELIRSAFAAIEGTDKSRTTLYLGYSAAALAKLGQTKAALDMLGDALQAANTTNEKFFAAELYRQRGEMLLAQGRAGEAESELQAALTIARNQQARLWELRAATSLGKHWHDAGKSSEARALLQPIYSWFSEGFDTADLKAAKALLDALGPSSDTRAQKARI